jgi:hypothetical protein
MKAPYLKSLLVIAALWALAQAPSAAAASRAWPGRVFAPYMYLGQNDDFKLTDCDDACGLKHYTLAFIIARQDSHGPGAKYYPEPAWDGRVAMDKNLYKDQIDAIRKRGGDVIVSFGGEAGRELAIVIEDPVALQKAYQAIIDRYHFTWLDFDVEGSNLDDHGEASRRRNIALAALQKKNPKLRISYTLPVHPTGLSKSSQEVLADAAAKGVKVYSADIMVMFFGKRFVNHGKSEGELGIESAETTHAQLKKIDPSIQVGLCPCLGRNGSADEVFTLEDAKVLKEFADKTPWVCSLHYWSINGDSGRPRRHPDGATNAPPADESTPRTPWAFANIFKSFTAQ